MAAVGRPLLALALARAAGATQEVAVARSCVGHDEEVAVCEGLPECKPCVPVACTYSDWGAWTPLGDCSQLCSRKRVIDVHSNECGEPCQGHLEETMRCPVADCAPAANQSCTLSDWSAWSVCQGDNDQKVRTRQVLQQPAGEGPAAFPCSGSLKQTESCGVVDKVDCEFSPWAVWTPCTKTCGGGQQATLRRVLKTAEHGGQACAGALRRTRMCNAVPCEQTADCVLSAWSAWTPCPEGPVFKPALQKRFRRVLQGASGGGKACEKALKEVNACPKAVPRPCELSSWSTWLECDKTCDGGQTYRTRQLLQPADEGGACQDATMKETQACNAFPCVRNEADCLFLDWGPWKPCSAPCGQGVTYRERSLREATSAAGKGCNGELTETMDCKVKECLSPQDCEWNEWEEWAACPVSCGGGTQVRSRTVKKAPELGGKPCTDGPIEEAQGCNTQSCSICKDGAWETWSDWSACSVSCDAGIRSRHRDAAAQPNDCGKPLDGLQDEYEGCESGTPCIQDIDCVLGAWSDWSDCSCTCHGVRERHREVSQYASGNGKTCSPADLKGFQQCNPSNGEAIPAGCTEKEPRPCEFTAWTNWGVCTKTCEGGQTTRTRSVLTPAAIDGSPCTGKVEETAGCNTFACVETCVDCEWGDWQEWHGCSRCNDQKYRRRVVKTKPNHCGKKCDLGAAKEVSACTGFCPQPRFCAWTEWLDDACPDHCGATSRLRRRTLAMTTVAPQDGALMQGGEDMVCGGVQVAQMPCPQQQCVKLEPVDCVFGPWGDWAPPVSQLCSRKRVVAVENTNGGMPCDGPLDETMSCPNPRAIPEDCVLSAWRDWSACPSTNAQSYRDRVVVKAGDPDGKPCTGHLHETVACGNPPPPVENCAVSEWLAWGPCSATCGSGTHERFRRITSRSRNGGSGCQSSLQEIGVCSTGKLCDDKVDCELGQWTAWSTCEPTSLQEERTRKIMFESTSGGAPCLGDLREVRACSNIVIDCKVSEWTAWDACDKGCGGGQQYRQRQVVENPQNGGQECPETIVETRGCNVEPCETALDCELMDWSEWGDCSASCATGQQTKTRKVNHLSLGGGAGCQGDMTLTRACDAGPCPFVDCVEGTWSDWGACSCSCGGGQMVRNRLFKVLPHKGGKPCNPGHLTEVAACNTDACQEECIDGTWGDWGAWGMCSKRCEGGLTFRVRKVLTEANHCGKPPMGESRETASCNIGVACIKAVDCVLEEWADWGDGKNLGCTRPCNGVQRRKRGVDRWPKGDGKGCFGSLTEMEPCNGNSSSTDEECMKVKRYLAGVVGAVGGENLKVDCNLGPWADWAVCSSTCGLGQTKRTRAVLETPKNGGEPCHGVLEETQGCEIIPCEPKCVPLDCSWSDWSSWGACGKCGGERRAFRHIMQAPACGGAECNLADAERIEGCTRQCHTPTYCSWGDWTVWGACSNTCGPATKARTRSLGLTAEEVRRHIVRIANSDGSRCMITHNAGNAQLSAHRCRNAHRTRFVLPEEPVAGKIEAYAAEDEEEELVGHIHWMGIKYLKPGKFFGCLLVDGEPKEGTQIKVGKCEDAPDWEVPKSALNSTKTSIRLKSHPDLCIHIPGEIWGKNTLQACSSTGELTLKHLAVTIYEKKLTANKDADLAIARLDDSEAGVQDDLERLRLQALSLETRRTQELVASFGCGLLACAVAGVFWRSRSRGPGYEIFRSGGQAPNE